MRRAGEWLNCEKLWSSLNLPNNFCATILVDRYFKYITQLSSVRLKSGAGCRALAALTCNTLTYNECQRGRDIDP
jgi:hypothetical protein